MPMNYGDLFTLNPIESVIKIDQADDKSAARRLVETFVITPSLGEAIESVALPQLDFTSGVEGFGVFVVGQYGTGKSHVLSFLSILAEDAPLLSAVRDGVWQEKLAAFAGQYKVKRCQIGASRMSLYGIVAQQLTELAQGCGFTFEFLGQDKVSTIKTELTRFMSEFDKACPGKGVLLIIDEMLRFLQSRPSDNDLVLDMSTL